MADFMTNEAEKVVAALLADYENNRPIDRMDDLFDQPDKAEIIDMTDKLIKIIFPGYFRDKSFKIYNAKHNISLLIEDVMYHMNKQITLALKYCECHMAEDEVARSKFAAEKTAEFMSRIPKIREYLDTDLEAFLQGDPAAFSREEIILCYPGFYAITINRMAHELYMLDVPMIPRIMTEHAHSITGIDINPGATIGHYFFIDHGTGIVIGETTVIGDNVKIYQGVTLGATSTRGGQALKNKRRHPTIEDNVTIYSGASILGGETIIGEGAVIGGNAFITHSVAPGKRVSIQNMERNLAPGEDATNIDSQPDDEASWFYII